MMHFTSIAEAKRQTGLSYIGKVNSSAKMMHSQVESHQYTYILYLSPANTSGYNVCSHSTPECRLGCLATSGRAGMELVSGGDRIKNARIKKTRLFYEEPEFFMSWVIAEICLARAKAQKDGFFFSVRLNGTSDIDWQNVKINGQTIFEIFPVDDYITTLPEQTSEFGNKTFKIKVNRDIFINDLLAEKEKAKNQKKMVKLMQTCLIFGVPDGDRYSYYDFKRPLSALPLDKLQTRLNVLVMENCKKGVQVLNTNLKEIGLVVN